MDGHFGEFGATGLLPGIHIGVAGPSTNPPAPDSLYLPGIKSGDQIVSALAFMPPVLADGLIAIGTLAIGTNAIKFQTTTSTVFRMAGIQYTKVATDDLVFAAADTINTAAAAGSFWGIWLVQIDPSLNITTKSPAADQVYTTEALAIAALPAVDADNVQLGYITVKSKAATKWTANTDDLTDGSDCIEANFVDTPGSFDANTSTLSVLDCTQIVAARIDEALFFLPPAPPELNFCVLVFWMSQQDKGPAYD